MNSTATLDDSFTALAHPARRTILTRLARGPATIGETTAGLGISKPAVTKHVRLLERSGVVERTVEGRTHRLRLVPEALSDPAEWIELHRSLWEARLDAVEQHLNKTKETR